MWPLKQRDKHNAIVSISLKPQQITCCYIQRNTPSKPTNLNKPCKSSKKNNTRTGIPIPNQENNTPKLVICAYEKKLLSSLEFEKSILFNPTSIGDFITQFIKKNNIAHPIIALSICGPTIFEKIVTLATSMPQKKDFKIRTSIDLHHTYLCPSLNGGFDFYLCGIRKEHLFQYTLLANKIHAKLACITTEQAAHICAYKQIQAQTWQYHSQGQLAIDLYQHNYNPRNLCEYNDIEKHCKLLPKLDKAIQKEYRYILTCIGLYHLSSQKI